MTALTSLCVDLALYTEGCMKVMAINRVCSVIMSKAKIR